MLLKNKLEKMKTFLDSDNVLASMEERYCYAEDASNLRTEASIPDLVVFVETIEDVQKVLRYAYQHSIPIVSRGAGTNMVGACLCTNGGIVLNFSKMNRILEINTINMTATVEPGVVLGNLKTEVEKVNLFYPPDPSNYEVSTIGGSIALNSSGARSFKYGSTKDYVLSLKVVTSDGNLVNVGSKISKTSFGYNLGQLFIGSEGTLGVVVEATLKLIPKPQATQSLIAYFSNVENMVEAVNSIRLSNLQPSAIDFVDQKSLKTIEEYIQLGLNVDASYMLLLELDGDMVDIESKQVMLSKILRSHNAMDVEVFADKNREKKLWKGRCSSFSATTRIAPDVVSDDIIVPNDKLIQLLNKCNEIALKYSLEMCLVGHIGDANLHPQIALNLNDEGQFRKYQSAKSELYEYVKYLGGIISAEHGVGIEKKKFFYSFIDDLLLGQMKQVKKMLDPQNILNPGKIFDV